MQKVAQICIHFDPFQSTLVNFDVLGVNLNQFGPLGPLLSSFVHYTLAFPDIT